MSHLGGPGPQIIERRPKRVRACLNCGRAFATTPSARLCPSCATRAQHLAGGVDEAAVALGGARVAAAGSARMTAGV